MDHHFHHHFNHSQSTTRPRATPQTTQPWLAASPVETHSRKAHDSWLQCLPGFGEPFTFSSVVPIEDEPELVHDGLPAEGLGMSLEREPHIMGKKAKRPLSMISLASATSSGSCLSSIRTEGSDANTIVGVSRETSPQKHFVPSSLMMQQPENRCNWGGCQSAFKTHAALAWHVKAEHLLICPVEGCTEGPFGSGKMVEGHVDVVHLKKEKGVREWSLEVGKTTGADVEKGPVVHESAQGDKGKDAVEGRYAIEAKKRKCQEQLDQAVERKAKRTKKVVGELPPFQINSDLAKMI